MDSIYITVTTNDDGRIIGWRKSETGYQLNKRELHRFSACSGNLYKVVGNALIFDETLEIIELPKPKTQIEIMQETLDILILEGLKG